MRDFFISYNHADERWAEWIAWTLADAGYSHYFQKWDFRPGGNFVLDMQKAASDSERNILVLSPQYLSSLFTQPEWAAFFNRDPTGEKRLIVPCRVERCEMAGMLASIVYCDLVGLGLEDARARLLAALRPSAKPEAPPAFPGPPSTSAAFPGPRATIQPAADPVRTAAQELQSIFATSGTTFAAQANLRDELARRICERLEVRSHHEYEELFDLYFTRLEPDELRLHRTIRAYTESILHEYNHRALQVIEREPGLGQVLPSVPPLRQHLIIWLNKFDRVFLRTPSMCLVYVGVEEAIGFPSAIEDELEHYLRTGQPAPQPSQRESRHRGEEHHEDWRYLSDFRRARSGQEQRFRALEQRMAELTSPERPAPADEFQREQVAAVEQAYSEFVADRTPAHTLVPEGFDWRPRLQALTKQIDAALRPDLPQEALDAAHGLHARPPHSEDWFHTELTIGLRGLAVLKRYERELGLAPQLSETWKQLLALLRSKIP